MKKFKSLIKSIFNPELHLTEEEKVILDIFSKLLGLTDTDKMMISTNYAYLNNPGLCIWAVVDGECVIIENGDETINIHCRYQFITKLTDMLGDTLEKDITGVYHKMSEKQLARLKSINSKILR